LKSLWSDKHAAESVTKYAAMGVGEDLALRVYTSRLLGGEPQLVLHGGGNTSVKTRLSDFFGHERDVLCVKGSGWDLGSIEPSGLPALHLAPLREVRRRNALSDEDMTAFLRANLLDWGAPNPSVETLLHAFLPHKFVDHTHATAILALTDQKDGDAICREVFGRRLAIVPYVMPGFLLAKAVADAFEREPQSEGVLLGKHGIFTFGETAREAYERMIDFVSLAEARINAARSFAPAARAGIPENARVEHYAPAVRAAASLDLGDGRYQRMIAEFRASPAIRRFVDAQELESFGARGVVTPDHIIRTKNKYLIAPPAGDVEAFATGIVARATQYRDAYDRYFAANNARLGGGRRKLDPAPRVVLVPGLGLFGFGRTKADAIVAADIAEITLETVASAERVGAFDPLPEADLFDMEYWSLEQAKLGKASPRPLEGQIAVITGGGGAIGAATARLFAANGAEVAVLDIDGEKAKASAASAGKHAIAIATDVTKAASVANALSRVVAAFGGVDILVSNAGAAFEGPIATLDEETLRRSFELNFFAHQRMAQGAVAIMRQQRTGGALLFNVSKQAVNPGENFGAYGLPKAASLFLTRQYALECARFGIRANAVNADRIRSGLLNDALIDRRASARGLSRDAYMSGNLLGLEVTADDVAQAFLHHALALKTTGDVTTVDGGNVAAMLR
jgi:rhamnose utilization protein RhaD (predicted bifunctional aldolase and dehydrogenase)/NAD(P)-dependent dehydrogenase (short-subunit alcohol dehydrogenase family)